MATLDSLAGDQRAVLQLVLGRGRSYAEIARLLSINPDSVRDRAVSALDALGPQTAVPEANRRLICDYLLGQLDEPDVPAARELLAHSAGERAWARVLHSELAPLASGPLPEIPSDAGTPAPAPLPDAPAPPATDPEPATEVPEAAAASAAPQRPRRRIRRTPRPAAESAPSSPAPSAPAADGGDERPRSSRRGGMVLIGLVAIVVIAVVLVLALHHKSGSTTASSQASAPTTTAVTTNPASSTETATTSASGTGSARYVTQINLSPTAAGSKAAAIADVIQEGANRELAIVGQNVPPNTSKNSYAVWLYNSQSSAVRLGFVSPGVSANGKLSAAGPLPSNAGDYKELIVTTETSAHPKAPGPILLQGAITGLS